MAYAIIQTGGKQYRVEKGDILDVEKLEVEPGANATFEEVLLVADGKSVSVGSPLVSGAKVTAEVLDQVKDKKVVAYKFKRRKGYHRTVGHRQRHTRLKITDIAA
ncbi:MAG: 50S ribosomal protein L21 [Chthoniobacterales bacterium]